MGTKRNTMHINRGRYENEPENPMAVCRSKRETLRKTPPSSTTFSTLRDMSADSAVQRRISASFRRFRGNFRREFDQTFHLDVWNERTNTTENRTEQQRKIMRSGVSSEGGVAVVESSRSFLSGSLSLCLTHSYIAASLVQLRTASHHRVGLFSAVHPSQSGILQCCHKKEFPCL